MLVIPLMTTQLRNLVRDSLLLLGLLVVVGPVVHAQQVENLSEQEELVLKRDVLKMQELVRLLYSQGRYQEAIEESEELLRLAPNNSTALLIRENAQRRIAAGETDPPTASGAGQISEESRRATQEAIAALATPAPTPAPVVESTATTEAPQAPVPSDNTMTTGRRLFGMPIWMLAAIVLVVLVIVAGVILLVLRNRGAKGASAAPAAAGGLTGYGISDLPTLSTTQSGVTGAMVQPTQPGYFGAITDAPAATAPTRAYSAPSVPLPSPSHDAHTNIDPMTAVEPQDQIAAAPQPSRSAQSIPPPEPPKQPADEAPIHDDDADLKLSGDIYIGDVAPATTDNQLGIDYSDTDSPAAQSQGADIRQTHHDQFKSTPAGGIKISDEVTSVFSSTPSSPTVKQPAAPAAPPAAPKSRTSTDSALGATTDNQPYMPGIDKPLPANKPAGAAPPAVTPDPGSVISLDISQPLPPAKPAALPPLPLPPQPPPRPEPQTPPPAAAPAIPDIPFVPAPSPAPRPGEDTIPGGQTFNTLMFGSDVTANRAPANAEPAPGAQGGEDLTVNSFNQQFSNLMFGAGNEQTRLGGQAAAPPPPSSSSMEVTAFLGAAKPANDPSGSGHSVGSSPTVLPPDSDDLETVVAAPASPQEKTVSIGAGGGGDKPAAGGKVSMFDRQRDAGKEAMDAGDYAKAVQCLSVAASLKPTDKDVRALLEEARRLRRGAG